jgi:hypothetical protein
MGVILYEFLLGDLIYSLISMHDLVMNLKGFLEFFLLLSLGYLAYSNIRMPVGFIL